MKETGGTTQFVILGMLARMPLTGYNIRKWMEHEYSHFWQVSFGQIYPALKELVREGLAERAGNAKAANGRGQIVYAITDAGRKALSEWMLEKPAVEKLRYEILLKISFGEQTEPDVLLGHLNDFIRRSEAALREMHEYLARFDRLDTPGANPVYSRLTALCGAYHYSAMRDWALEARKILTKKEAD